MRLLPAFAAAILFALSGGVAEAPFEIPAIAPLFVLGFAGLCLACRETELPGALAILGPLAVVTLPPGSRWLVAQALAVVLFLDIVLRLRRRLDDRNDQKIPTPAELFGLTLFLHVALAGRAYLPWQLTWTSAASLLLPPLVAAFALDRITRRRGFDIALGLAAIVAALGSGWTAAGLLPLLALAAADELAHGNIAGTTALPNLRRTVAVLVLVAPCLIATRIGLLSAVAGLAVAFPQWRWRIAGPLAVLLAAIAFRLREPNDSLPQLLALAAVAPSAFLVARRDLGLVVASAFLGTAGLLAGPLGEGGAESLLATLAPAAMVALAAPRGSRGGALQRVWSLGLVALAILTASFPWLARSPVERVAGLGRVAALSILDLARGAPGWNSLAASRDELHGDPLRIALPKGVRRISIVSQLANSAQLPRGTAVARLRLSSGDGRHTTYPLRSGIETGEWAARRAELRGLPGSHAPEPWRSFVAPPSATHGAEIGQIYRAEFSLPSGEAATALEILRSPELPAGTLFEVRGVEWR